MYLQLCIFLALMFIQPNRILEFTKDDQHKSWFVLDDVVMGGVSQGKLDLEAGTAHFHGLVSTENYGGFSSIRQNFSKSISCAQYNAIKIRVKGDGSTYQLRLKSSAYQRQSYIHEFNSTNEWQELTLPLKDFYPSFRGRKLDMPNFDAQEIASLSFLISTKQTKNFSLYIDYVELLEHKF